MVRAPIVTFTLVLLADTDYLVSDEEQQARRRYKKDLAHLKPDLETYSKQKALAMGSAPGSSSSSSNALTAFNPQGGTVRAFCCFLFT